MKEVNFEAIYEHVGTQYGDLTGVIQIDGHSNISSIYELCKDFSVDLKDKFIVGFGLGDSSSPLGVGHHPKLACTILTIDTKVYGSTFDDVEKKIKAGGDSSLKVTKTTVWLPYADIHKYIKRFNFLATTELTKYVDTIDVIDELDNESDD